MKIDDYLKDRPDELEWTKPSAPGPGSTIGERIEYSFAEAIRRVFALFDEPLSELLSIPLRILVKVIEKSTAKYMKPILDHAIKNMDDGDPWRKLFQDLRDPTGEGAMALLAGVGSSAGSAGLMSIFEPAFERFRQNAYLNDPTKLPDPATLLALYARGRLTDDQLDEWFQRQGFQKAYAEPIWDVLRPRIGFGEMGELVKRGDRSTADFLTELKARGLTAEDADGLELLLHMIPGAGDLIRMAVREAFTPEVIDRFQLGAEFPADFAEWMERLGFDTEWAQRYWYSHWELPSISMGYEMLHRGVIGGDEFDLLLKTLDVSPYWRDKLKEISFNTYTRVDTRRMYDMGILDEQGVLESYTDQGYPPDRAANMTAFTVALSQDEQRAGSRIDILNAFREGVIDRSEAEGLLTDLGYQDIFVETYILQTEYKIEQDLRKRTGEQDEEDADDERQASKTDITSSYEIGIYTEDEAKGMLTDIGFAPDLAEVLILKVDYRRAQKMITEAITTTKDLYVNEEINVAQVHDRLGEYTLPSTQIADLITTWTLLRERRTARPSITQLITFYKRERMDEGKLRDQLKKHKLSAEYIDLYVGDANQAILDSERAEAERLLKEQEREATSEFRDERRIALNALDIQIQDLKVYAAELKVLKLDTTDGDVLIQIKRELAAIAVEVAKFRLTKLEYPVIVVE